MSRGPRYQAKPIERLTRVLFLSTGNAARSPIAASVLGWLSSGTIEVHSAGVSPIAEIHPMARAAVRHVFNGRLDRPIPRSVHACEDEYFDYVFTLSEEARRYRPSLPGDPKDVHWDLEDPAAVRGTRDDRQRAFDRVTRELVKRLRAWWLCQEAMRRSGPASVPELRRRTITHAHWRTRPGGDAPLLAVAYRGPLRQCRNMCTLLERAGFQVVCGEKYAGTTEALPVLPDGLVVRVDGSNESDHELRPEFRAVQAIRAKRPAIPILVLVDHLPSACEEEAMQDCGVRIVRRLPQSRGVLLEAMWRLVERLTCLLVFWPVDAESVLLFL